MKDVELMSNIQKIIPKLYGYAYALVPDELMAEQILVDATSVSLMKEKNLLISFSQEIATKKEALLFKKKLQLNLIKEVWFLAKKRSSELPPRFKYPENFNSFYELDLLQRSALYLKEKEELKWEDILFVHELKKYQVVEKVYQAREKILTKMSESYAE